MAEQFEAIAEGEISKLRSAHPGISVRPPRCASPGGGTGEAYSVALDIRGPEYQELIAGKPAASIQKAVDAAFGEARDRLRMRSARRQAAMHVALACAVPQSDSEEMA